MITCMESCDTQPTESITVTKYFVVESGLAIGVAEMAELSVAAGDQE